MLGLERRFAGDLVVEGRLAGGEGARACWWELPCEGGARGPQSATKEAPTFSPELLAVLVRPRRERRAASAQRGSTRRVVSDTLLPVCTCSFWKP